MSSTIDIHAELDALRAQFIAVNQCIFNDLSDPTVAAVSAEFLDIANWIDEVRYDLMLMGLAATIRATRCRARRSDRTCQ